MSEAERTRSRLFVLGTGILLALLLLALGSAQAQAAPREFVCQITANNPPTAAECNGTGNTISNGGIIEPRGTAIDPAGNIWIADATGRALEFDSSGNFLRQNDGSTTWISSGALSDVTFGDATNLVYGAAGGAAEIWKISPDASSPGALATEGTGGGRLAVDNSSGPHAGDIYAGYGFSAFGSSAVLRYKADGSPDPFEADQPYLTANGITGYPGSTSLSVIDVAVDPEGGIYVLSSNSTGQNEILRYAPDGAFVRGYTGQFGAGNSDNSLEIDPDSGNLLIHDFAGPNGETIWELDYDGVQLREITGASANTPDETFGSGGGRPVSVGPDGKLYVPSEGAIQIIGAGEPLPRITNGPETGATRTEIDVHATVDPNGAGDITGCRVEYGTTFSFEAGSVPCDPAPSPKFSTPTVVEAHLTGIQAEEDYHYRVVVDYPGGERRGIERSFRLTAVDGVHTGTAGDLTNTTATLNGSFSDDGAPAKFFFEYGNTPKLGQRVPAPPGADAPGGGGTVPVSTGLTELLPGTVYYYRVAISTSFGTTRGLIESFETLQPPTIESFSAKEINETSADLIGQINPNGFATTYRFEYGPTTGYGQSAPVPDGALPAGSTVQSVQVQLDELAPHTTYHFRLVAESERGTVMTEDQTFTFFPPTCPNGQVRLETGSSYLPDCRAYELVSPADAGGILLSFDAPTASSASSPARFAFSGLFGVLPGIGLPPNVQGDLYVAERSATGWNSKYVGPSSNEALEVGGPPGPTLSSPTAILTDPTLSNFMIWNNGTTGYICPCVEGSEAPYIYNAGGNFIERFPTNVEQVPGGLAFKGEVQPAADFKHIFFSSLATPFATGGRTTAPGSAYDENRATGAIELISIAPGPGGGPILQDPEGPKDPNEFIRFPAISSDGSHALMSTAAANGRHLYMRAEGKTVDVSIDKDGKNVGVEFDEMTSDGSKVIFSSSEPLTADDHDHSVDIFSWSNGVVTRISTGSGESGNSDECSSSWTSGCNAVAIVTPSNGGGLFGQYPNRDSVFGTRNGEAWFYSPEQLDGSRGLPGQRNLYTIHDGRAQFVANVGQEPLLRIQVAPDNGHAAFLTRSRITSYDNHGFAEMYSYDIAQQKLVCVSCLPSGASPTSDVVGSQNGLYMSDDGRTFFTTADPLVEADVNGLRDTYEYVDGRPQLISTGLTSIDSGLSGIFKAGLVGVSHNGVDVYFATFESLVAQDHNGQFMRFYDARINGGFPFRPPPSPCAAADECHGADSSPPIVPEITSGAKLGKGGNVVNGKQKPKKAKKCAKKKAHCKKGKKQKKSNKSQTERVARR